MIDRTKETFKELYLIDESGCWNFKSAPSSKSYGQTSHQGKIYRAHRLSWMLHVGEIPEGLWVLHKCDNPRCVNPDHLFLGTAQDNTDDMIRKGRQVFRKWKTHCKRGHELTNDNSYIFNSGTRTCKICIKIRSTKEYKKLHRKYKRPKS